MISFYTDIALSKGSMIKRYAKLLNASFVFCRNISFLLGKMFTITGNVDILDRANTATFNVHANDVKFGSSSSFSGNE